MIKRFLILQKTKNMKCLKIKISGKVQGVWFRASTQRKARELGIKGIVKNLSSGEVYVEAEGSEEKLETFIKWCHQGSELSRVDQIEISEIENQNFEDFKIVR